MGMCRMLRSDFLPHADRLGSLEPQRAGSPPQYGDVLTKPQSLIHVSATHKYSQQICAPLPPVPIPPTAIWPPALRGTSYVFAYTVWLR